MVRADSYVHLCFHDTYVIKGLDGRLARPQRVTVLELHRVCT
jgi:hypothetical protein